MLTFVQTDKWTERRKLYTPQHTSTSYARGIINDLKIIKWHESVNGYA